MIQIMKILTSHQDLLLPEAAQLLEAAGHDLHYFNGFTKAELAQTEVLIVSAKTSVDSDLLGQFPRMQYLLSLSASLDHVDLDLCESLGIKVIHAGAADAESVAEQIVLFSLMLRRHSLAQIESLKNHHQRNTALVGDDLSQAKYGLIGMGAVGKATAQKLRGMGVEKIYGFDPYVSEAEMRNLGVEKTVLPALLKHSEIISVQVPLTPRTKGMLGEQQFQLMAPSSVLINVSRGAIINDTALIQALNSGQIKGAALDIFENEAEVNNELVNHPRVIATPHVSAYTHNARKNMQLMPIKTFLKLTEQPHDRSRSYPATELYSPVFYLQ